MFVATLVNPYGYQLYPVLVGFRAVVNYAGTPHRVGRHVLAAFARARGFWAYLGFLALCLAVVVACRRNLRAADILLLIAFGYLSMDRQRHIVLFAFVSLYVLARVIGPRAIGPRATRGAMALLLVSLLAGGAMLLRYGNLQGEFPYSVPSRKFTPQLIEYVDSRDLRGNVFNSFELGAELVHKFYPRLRPAIDFARRRLRREATSSTIRSCTRTSGSCSTSSSFTTCATCCCCGGSSSASSRCRSSRERLAHAVCRPQDGSARARRSCCAATAVTLRGILTETFS